MTPSIVVSSGPISFPTTGPDVLKGHFLCPASKNTLASSSYSPKSPVFHFPLHTIHLQNSDLLVPMSCFAVILDSCQVHSIICRIPPATHELHITLPCIPHTQQPLSATVEHSDDAGPPRGSTKLSNYTSLLGLP